MRVFLVAAPVLLAAAAVGACPPANAGPNRLKRQQPRDNSSASSAANQTLSSSQSNAIPTGSHASSRLHAYSSLSSTTSTSPSNLSSSTTTTEAKSASQGNSGAPEPRPYRITTTSSKHYKHKHPSPASAHATGSAPRHPRPTSSSKAKQACEQLPEIILAGNKMVGIEVVDAFATWYEAGSNPSLELLTSTYPHGWVTPGTNVDGILNGVGPDVDLTQDHGYARNGQDSLVTNNGPLGGLPGFCRLGANIRTSKSTEVLTEIWLPMADEFAYTGKPTWSWPTWPVAQVNSSDYPTSTTPYEIDTNRDSLFLRWGWQNKYGNDTVYDQSNPSTRFHYVKSPGMNELTWSLNPYPNAALDQGGRSQMLEQANGQAERRRQSSSSTSGSDVLGNGASTAWSGRQIFLANGGQRGWVPWPDMKLVMSRYRTVVIGTNTGHFSTTGSATWMKGNDLQHKHETALDWTSRATHVSTLLSRWVVDEFYGPDAGVRGGTSPDTPAHSGSNRLRTYFAGCSVGGRNGMASAQVNPGDFDGIFSGSPAVYFNRMNAGQLHTQSIFRKSSAGKGQIKMAEHWAAIHDVVLKQCGNDAGMVVDPVNCAEKKLDLSKDLQCSHWGAPRDSLFGHDHTQCLTPAELRNLERLFQPAVVQSKSGRNHTVYPAYLPGVERSPATARGQAAKARAWFEYAIFNWPDNSIPWDPYTNLTYEEVEQGQQLNIGGSNADVEDLSAFFKDPNRKLIHTHGLADLTISPLASREYHDGVHSSSTHPMGDVSSSYRYFEVPGMLHCRDGDGPWHFGSVTQKAPGNRPLQWDTEHDVLMRLIAWAEGQEGAPEHQVAAGYATLGGQTDGRPPAWSSNYGWGVRLTRKLCPYPSRPVYDGFGPTTGLWAQSSYTCQ